MRSREVVFLLAFGILFWVAGTLWYEARGPRVFESTALRYWINFGLTPIVTAAVCIVGLRWLGTAPQQWSSAMLLVAIPGMVGEAILLSNFAKLMPRMQEASAGRYGAFLFSTYALALSVAEIVTLRAGGLAL